MRHCYVIVLCCVLYGLPAISQEFPDTSFRQKSIENVLGFYRTSIGLQAHLYNGPLYEPYPRPFTEGHQYLSHDSITAGSVTYDGLEYHNIRMRYDLIRDELIMYHPNGFPISLIKEKVDSFSLDNRRFIKLKNNRLPITLNPVGYHELLYSSSAIVFVAKRVKSKEETVGRFGIETAVYSKHLYYILRGGVFHSIRNKKSLIEILKDKKVQTQQYIKNNKLRFKKFEQDVLQTVIYYDQLK